MGQSQSTEGSAGGLVEAEEPPVKLSSVLERKIAFDFQNEKLNEAWKDVQLSVLQRRNQRAEALNETMARKVARQQGELQEMQARHVQLDRSIEGLKKQFDDEYLALEYGTKTLSEGLEEKANSSETLPCLGPRAHWMDCQKKYARDSRPCDAYLSTLEKCVTDAVVKSVA